ncbi:MAG: hypothetical protein ABFD86_09545 [Bryobacteraceae bacterium]
MPHPIPAFSRRSFCASSMAATFSPLFSGIGQARPWAGPAAVRKVYVAVHKPTWPKPGVDIEATRAEIDSKLGEIERRHPELIKFMGGELVHTMDDAAAYVKSLDQAATDAHLVITITSGSDGMVKAIGSIGLPTLLFVRPYAGHAWGSFSEFAQAGNKADVLASSDYDDLDVYARIFYTIHAMRKSKILIVVPGPRPSKQAEEFSRQFGTAFRYIEYADLKAAYDRIGEDAARKEADRYAAAALRIMEPSREQIYRGTRFYLGVKELLERESANGITIDCLGGINRGEMPGYPCISFSRLDDEGLFGVCQADLGCTMTELLLTSFTGKPGFLFNVVIDTSRNEIIQSHCTAPTSMRGIGAPPEPYILRSHLETSAGAAVQVLMPIGEAMTVARFLEPKRLATFSVEAIANVTSDEGCRTQLRTRVRNARKILNGFKGIVHRVSYYGDYADAIEKMGRLMAFEVIEEG